MTYSRISGTGSYLPDRIMTNAELEALVDTTDAWIQERTGIRERRIVAEGQLCSDLAIRAARAAMESANVQPQDIDLLVLGTCTPDQIFPSTACLVQHALGMRPGSVAFDVAAACSGFMYALDIADRYIRTGGARRALVIGAETMSRVLNWKDRGTCILFGDGGGAVVLEAAEEPGIYSSHLHADGQYEELLTVPWGVSQGLECATPESGKITMRGNEVFKFAVRTLGQMVDETLAANNMTRNDVDWLVPHQANIRIIQATAKKLGMSMDQVIQTVAYHGNTSSASIPLALDEGIRDGRIKRGQMLLLEAFGGGFTWGSALIRY
ncbi:3-oxoacyl-[acyl-carrier-protein] synthase-3 [Natronocella acetinitrilica]|uniref:Beta-ketoacyl-[acyl-carrier-protein] synthase III n=1 Tax=Natronocella acetinitrilica TaxID=414046 RepID=A0AAE3G5M3_9GAMM|nr:3-oxoacyl-[acyl-carrier-protein] synthase-3 [Natronocella acetinitrilica]